MGTSTDNRTNHDLCATRLGQAVDALKATIRDLDEALEAAPRTERSTIEHFLQEAHQLLEGDGIGTDSGLADYATGAARRDPNYYEVGDIVTRRCGRKVLVTRKLKDVKNGMPGYDGRTIETNDLGYPDPSDEVDAWGYNADITAVERRTR